jgi:hypothetical protein
VASTVAPAAVTNIWSNQVQQIAVVGGATSGTFDLTFDNGITTQTATAIPFNADAATIQSQLEGLSNGGVGNFLVTGGPLPLAPINVEFQGIYARTSLPVMGVMSAVSPGTVSVTETEPVVRITLTSTGPNTVGASTVVTVQAADLGGSGPTVVANTVARTVTVTLDTQGTSARQVVNAINLLASSLVSASLTAGHANRQLVTTSLLGPQVLFSPLTLSGANAAAATITGVQLGLPPATPLEIGLQSAVTGPAGANAVLVITRNTRGAGAGVGISVNGSTVTAELNSTPGSLSTAADLVNAINGSAAASAILQASLPVGAPGTTIVTASAVDLVGVRHPLAGGNDVPIVPGYVGIGDNSNEVVVRFASTLPDDDYRLEVLGVGSFAEAITDFGTTLDANNANDVQVRIASRAPGALGNGQAVQILKSDRGVGVGADFRLNGSTIVIELNSNDRESARTGPAGVRQHFVVDLD